MNDTPTDSQWTRSVLNMIQADISSALAHGANRKNLVIVISTTAQAMILRQHGIPKTSTISDLFGVLVHVDPDESVRPFVLVEI